MLKFICRVAMWWVVAIAATGLHAQTVNAHSKLDFYPRLIVQNAKIVLMDDYSLNHSFGKAYQAMAVRGDCIPGLSLNR
jgi:hypothetical protein